MDHYTIPYALCATAIWYALGVAFLPLLVVLAPLAVGAFRVWNRYLDRREQREIARYYATAK